MEEKIYYYILEDFIQVIYTSIEKENTPKGIVYKQQLFDKENYKNEEEIFVKLYNDILDYFDLDYREEEEFYNLISEMCYNIGKEIFKEDV